MDLTQKTKQAYDEKWQEAKEKLELQQQKTLGTNHFLCYFNKFHNRSQSTYLRLTSVATKLRLEHSCDSTTFLFQVA